MARTKRNFEDAQWQKMSIEEGPGTVPLGADKFAPSAVKMSSGEEEGYNLCNTDMNLKNIAYAGEQDEDVQWAKATTHKLWAWAFWFGLAGLTLLLTGRNVLGEDSTKTMWNVTNETTNVVTLEPVPALAYPMNILAVVLMVIALSCAILGMFCVEKSPGFWMFGCRACGCKGCNYWYFLFNDLTCGLGGLCCPAFIKEQAD